jgi:hypothetical protein
MEFKKFDSCIEQSNNKLNNIFDIMYLCTVEIQTNNNIGKKRGRV